MKNVFEKHSYAILEVIATISQDNFDPGSLSTNEQIFFNELFEQCSTVLDKLDCTDHDYDNVYNLEQQEEEYYNEYWMHRNIVGEEQADDDFSRHTFTRND